MGAGAEAGRGFCARAAARGPVLAAQGRGRAGPPVGGPGGAAGHASRAHAPPPPRGALTRQRSWWSARGASGFLCTNGPPRARSRPFPPPCLGFCFASPPAPSGAGHGRAGVSLCRPCFRVVRGVRQGSCPVLLPGPHYVSQRAAPPRAWAAEAVPAGSWSSQRPRAR